MFRVFSICAVLTGAAVPAQADQLLGTWLTPPDKKGQVAHIEAHRCGDAVCGEIVRTYDNAGNPVTTPNLGKRLFWDMKQVSPGEYAGMGWVPLHDVTFQGKMKVQGDRMVVRGCVAFVCQSQTWQRVRASS